MGLNQIVTPLDSAVLETKEQYSIYFKIVNHAFIELANSISTKQICNEVETTYIKQYGELLIYSLEAFRLKYLFDDEEKMRVDLTESGFPSFLEFRYLLNDLELKNEHIGKLPEVANLKAEFLETLLKERKPISERKLHQAASIVYYSSVDKNYIFKRFVQGKIVPNTMSDEGEYLVSWAFYDVSFNRPFICFMYFDIHKEDIATYKEEIYKVLETVADRNMSMDMMAYAIDKKLTKLLPKKFKKVDLGPIHSVFAKDELEITHVLLQSIFNKSLDLSSYAISLRIEETKSTGSFAEGNFFNKQHLQVWKESKPKQLVLTSHRVMQVLYDSIPETIRALTEDPIEIGALKL